MELLGVLREGTQAILNIYIKEILVSAQGKLGLSDLVPGGPVAEILVTRHPILSWKLT